ncbi:putative TIM-barrel fold metal-dependent hydrolase [Amorphus suaedae]
MTANTRAAFDTSRFDNFNTEVHLKAARDQAEARNYDEFLIVDVDSHHYETEAFMEFVEYIEDPVLREEARYQGMSRGGIASVDGSYQEMGGRVIRYPLRAGEKVPTDIHRDITMMHRWMDPMGVDMACMFPTPMLNISTCPRVAVEVALARAYNRWLCDNILDEDPRLTSMLYLPFNDAEASFKMIEEFGERKGVIGFMVTSPHKQPVYDNRYIKTYAALEERGLPLGFHAGFSWAESSVTTMNRFISVHALGFVWHNLVQMTNWLMNGLPERFPKLKTIWIESGLAWIPFLMQRLDNEFMMRSSDAPLLKRLPSEYMQDMFYTTQPMEMVNNQEALELTFKMIKAETQLLYSSDYPHWDMDLPSTIYDLPFLSEQAKRGILGGNAKRLFNLQPQYAPWKQERQRAKVNETA